MKVLFITRNFPPQKGGLERVAFHLYSYLKKDVEVVLLKWSGSRKLMFIVLPYFLIRAFWVVLTRRVNIVYLNEGFLSILGITLKPFKLPIVITIHGLDITYQNKLYQFIIPKCITRLDRVICISRATKRECIRRGIDEHKISVVPDGFRDEFYIDGDKKKLRRSFMEKHGLHVEDKKILLSVCRLIERKGIHWFVDKVIPILKNDCRDFIYLVVGDGPIREKIEDIISEQNLYNWIMLLGKVDDEKLKLLYNISDIFIMPNIPVEGDIEGFGVVMLEAASCKIPVVASNLEGIKDALLDGNIGILVPPLNIERFREEILNLCNDNNFRREYGEKARRLVFDNFEWGEITNKYLNIFREVM